MPRKTDGKRLRDLRIQRSWTLNDIARALGVAIATVSRVERGLQEPSTALLDAWEGILKGKRQVTRPPHRRRPRGALNLMAELFLSDVKAGLDWSSAGWREPEEIGLTEEDIGMMGEEIQRDGFGRVRVSSSASLERVEEAKNILKYRRTVDEEGNILTPTLENRIPSLWLALKDETVRGAVVFSGLTKMIRYTAPLVLDSLSQNISANPASLLSGPTGVATLVLEVVGVPIPDRPADVLNKAGFGELVEPSEDDAEVQAAQKVASELQLSKMAECIGKEVVIILGISWAFSCIINARKASVLTEIGQQHVAEAFWQGCTFQRNDVVKAWGRLTDSESDDELERIGGLLWAWPEVL
jgi:transcriptional regulator with XRE-family HTH domain